MVETFKNPPASLGIDALADQTAAGGIAWAFSEIPSVLVLIALLFQWYSSEQRQARRKDRAADRDGDQELEAYNAYLASLRRTRALNPGHHGGDAPAQGGPEEGVAMAGARTVPRRPWGCSPSAGWSR